MREEPLPPAVAEPTPPDPLAQEVATAVAGLRRERGLSERSAARLLRTSQTQLRRMEDPRYLPSLRSLARLAQAYGYTLTVKFTRPEPATTTARKTRQRPSASASPSKAR
ncbi:MAG: helix-turn-helix domain-containing protein, partial [Chloroflexota bacterium]|nr:helix-turn-helix domain-containing protein [Chloroflexota bacterium]